MKPEFMMNDLRELIADLDQFRERLIASLEEQSADGPMDPLAGARWDGAFMMLRFSVLGERLLPMLERWEKGQGFYRSTEKIHEDSSSGAEREAEIAEALLAVRDIRWGDGEDFDELHRAAQVLAREVERHQEAS